MPADLGRKLGRVATLAAIGAAMHAGPVVAAIETSSPSASIRIPQNRIPIEIGLNTDQFSLVMWLRRTASDTEPMYLFRIPGNFEVFIDPADETIHATLTTGAGPLDLALPLHDGAGEVPVDEWMLIAATWLQTTGQFSAWVRSESVASVEATVSAPGAQVAAPAGDLFIGRPDLAGVVAQQGVYGLMAIRDHAMGLTDFLDLWSERDYIGPYRMESGSFNGVPGAAWMVNHAIPSNPAKGEIPATTPAFVDQPVTATNYCVLPSFPFGNAFFRAGEVVSATGGDSAFIFRSPYDDGFFQRKAVDIGLVGPPSISTWPSPLLHRLADDQPSGVTRVIVSANSRGVASSDAQEQTFPENYAHGFIAQRLGSTAGVLNRPARTISASRWFGYDATDGPRKIGGFAQVDVIADPRASFGHFCTNSGQAGAIGPGVGVYFEDGATLSMKCRPEAGSLMDGSNGDGTNADFPLDVTAYLLRFPGAGSVVRRPEKATAQHLAGTFGSADVVDLDTTVVARGLTSADIVNPSNRVVVLDGNHAAGIEVGDACFISSGAGALGISVVESIQVLVGPQTRIVLEKWFPENPVAGSSTLLFGPWSIFALDHAWPALDASDPEIWRGLELTASGGPLFVMSYDAVRPDVSGWAFGTYGTGGDGYTEQIAEAFSETHARLIAALQPDIWLEGFAEQMSAASSLSDFLTLIRDGAPNVEAAWIGETVHEGDPLAGWHHYCIDNASAEAIPAVSVLEEPDFGRMEDQAVDGLRLNSQHYSHRGNSRLAERWLQLLRQAALEPADIDQDGTVGVGDLLILLGSIGPCEAPCPPACPGDVNADCAVDVVDLLALLSAWDSP